MQPLKKRHLSPLTRQPSPAAEPCRIPLRVLLYGILAISLMQFVYRVSLGFGTYYSVDMPLFLQTAYDYLASQTLYRRADDLQHLYQPGAGVYKYPPLYQLTIVPWFAQGWPEHVYFMVLRTSMLLMYLGSAGLMIRKVAALQVGEFSKSLFYTTAAITTLWFVPFHASHGVVSEIFILFLLSLFIYFYTSKPVLSGVLLGVSSMLKVYPVFLIGFSILVKNKRNIIGFIMACLLATALTMAYFGLAENLFFFFKLLPVLLSERVSDYGSNLNIEAFFLSTGLIKQGFPLFNIQKIIVLGALAFMTYQYRNAEEKIILLILSLWICAMLLFLSNYWLQYQLILILPIIALLAHAVKKCSWWQWFTVSLVIITMSIDDSWSDTLLRHAMEKKQLTSEMVIDRAKNAGILRTGLEISPAAILVMAFSVIKVFVPHLLFIMTVWILLTFPISEKTPISTTEQT